MADPLPDGRPPYREPPAFNVPRPVLGLLLLVVGVHLAVNALDPALREQVILWFALFPIRYTEGASAIADILPGGLAAELWTPVTYTFLHGGWEHLIVNSVWLLAFGSPIAQRFGATRFLLFYFLCGAAGAFLHVLLYPGSDIPVVGASAAISGLMGGAARFVFLADGPLGALGGRGRGGFPAAPRRRASIAAALGDRRTLIFVGVWIGLNFLFGATALSGAFGVTAQVAWEAHLGGFLMGLLIFGLFDPPRWSPSGGPGNVGYGEWLGEEPHE
ncbi:rhomboid family intramembrane serine protease [Parvibaculum sp.]|jgi:membrane associated rhomboid family serine protease|uniref:rhomboid family intramembrane serine protease n=1 Tax=Parvibaculum sp. TaxID=2024848 RepID=UPI001B0CB489|nr:rhomboid family intramembrane serine protease [Parvibaculum sp.]MBO6633531.1 rhomboid family intramembrane serine protease [Parvibaculum sp.]MBO6679993.1 rhomboid family intramembrane serine protease [Parvibaculum sp.]MBO6683554.1 rhomboid family intramembrane serine protease [Parvibaculum sp.]MBO6904682.1 rhomboid family intramembrane serine protease [Parvibaculum sp.]